MLKYKVNFYVNNSAKDSESPVRCLVSFNSTRPAIYTGITARPSEWDKENQRLLLRKDPRNKDIDQIEDKIENIFKQFDIIHKRYPTPEELQDHFTNKASKKARNSNLTIIEAIDLFTDEVGAKDSWAKSTYSKFKILRFHLENYNPDLTLADLTESDLIGFVRYYQTNPAFRKKNGEIIRKAPNKNVTIARDIKHLTRLLKWAHYKGLYKDTLHENFRPKLKGSQPALNDPVYLTWEELLKFYNHEFDTTQKHLEETRDMVAFCCFTSLRFSDLKSLTRSHIQNDVIVMTSQKSTDALKIELNNYSKKILDKYTNSKSRTIFPIKDLERINNYLKTIGQILKFERPIHYTYFIGNQRFEEIYPLHEMMSSHIGRKTFIVNGLRLGIPAEVIMKCTGHNDYKAMRPYIAIVDELKKAEMDKFNV